MADDNLYEVWGDTVDSRHLLAAIAVGAACSLGTFFLAEHLLTGWVESTQMARAYAMLLGILGSLLGGGISAWLFKPKRHVVEQVSDPAWRLQVIEELRAEYGGLGQLAGLQGEFTGHHRFQRQFLSGRGPHGGLGRHRRQGLGAGQGQQQNTGDANQCGHRRHRGLKMSSNGQQLIASN